MSPKKKYIYIFLKGDNKKKSKPYIIILKGNNFDGSFTRMIISS